MTSKLTITDERVISVIERLEHYACNLKWTNVRGAQDLLTAADGLRELQERRKADSEPVAWLATYHGEVYDEAIGITRSVVEDQADHFGWELALTEIIPLYRHAQQPVVPDEKPMPNPLSMYAIDAVADIAEVRGWNACRAAMLQGKAEPVSLHPELSVWYGSMPESNGKSNWTAILHRKGECLSTGITIELSEHPERVRYEADRVRHIIGELKEEPDILAYDADAHSGYVKPGNSPVIPDGSASMLRRWLVFGRGMQNAGSQLPHNLIAETEEILAAADCSIPMISDRWVPVSERMPDENAEQQVLACFKGGDISTLYYFEGRWGDAYGIVPIRQDVTHWMPLPADPQEVNHG
ncbi:DUF551 domain-containing protein [Raoultella planticola]|uniref:DUF551 domain-containing protein n=1 Tax=Raoultella planticola TaxID=575 RepID=UPI002FFA82ED